MSVKKLLNPNAAKDSTLAFHASEVGCCGKTHGDVCAYIADAGTSTGILSEITITSEGVNKVIEVTPATTAKEQRMAIAKALESVGYDAYFEDEFKGVTVKTDKIIIIGEAPIISVKHGTTTTTFEKFCNPIRTCVVSGTVDISTAVDLTFLGNTESVGASANPTELINNLIASLDNLGVDFTVGSVVAALVNGSIVFEVELHGLANESLLLEGSELELLGCKPGFGS